MSDHTGCTPTPEKATGNRPAFPPRPVKISPLLTVIVVASDGRPLNPCHPARARELIRKHRAKRIHRHPYTTLLLGGEVPL